MTQWAQIENMDYQVNSLGEIRSLKTNKVIKNYQHSGGYRIVHLRHENRRHAKYVHRIVAKAFLQNPECLKEVNHKNFDKSDNRLDNLEWCDRKHNLNHAIIAGRNKNVQRHKIRNSVHFMIGKMRIVEIANHFKVSPSLIQSLGREIFSYEELNQMALRLRPFRAKDLKGRYI